MAAARQGADKGAAALVAEPAVSFDDVFTAHAGRSPHQSPTLSLSRAALKLHCLGGHASQGDQLPVNLRPSAPKLSGIQPA